jgi:hypothetical protein
MPVLARAPLALVLALSLSQALAACDKSCERLKAHFCDDERYRKDNPKHCELFEDEARAALYTPEACKSALERLDLR